MTNEDKLIEKILNKAIDCISEKKGEKIVSLKFLPDQTSLCDYFLICEATNTKQAQAISDFLQRTLRKEFKIRPSHVEGYENAKWILLDYFDIIIHIFLTESRNFYALEKLWADAQIKNYN